MTREEFEKRLNANREARSRLGDPYGTFSDELERLCLEYIGDLNRQITILSN